MSVETAPLLAQDRIESIDVLRGFALLGILLINIQSFAMVEAAFFDPSKYGGLTGVNWWVWAISHALADMKFMAIFSMLFGAGVIIATQSRDAKGQPSIGYHFRRNLLLLGFGMIHAYFIWYGDILVTYAVAGFLIYWVRKLRARWLLVIGAAVLSVPLLISLSLTFAPPEVIAEVAMGFAQSDEEIAAELAAYRGSWSEAFAARVPATLDMHLAAIPAFLIWRAGGLMLVGMALYKTGVLAGKRSARYYNTLTAVGFVIGLPLVVMSVINQTAHEYDPMIGQLGIGTAYNYLGSIALALAYVSGTMRLCQSNLWPRLTGRLAAVGRTAFTNYILQSVICTFIFYGFGLGLFGRVDRWGQVLIVLGIWALQLMLAPFWLQRYRFGPLEWLWRSLTYGRFQPMKRDRATV